MKRSDFIKRYCDASGIPAEIRTARGFLVHGAPQLRRRAVPCFCGEGGCPGWQMVNEAEWREDPRQ